MDQLSYQNNCDNNIMHTTTCIYIYIIVMHNHKNTTKYNSKIRPYIIMYAYEKRAKFSNRVRKNPTFLRNGIKTGIGFSLTFCRVISSRK